MAVDLSMSVLVVDDYSTMIRIIRNLLKQLGFENIDDASDGSAALNKMRGKKYGLVISDWNMEPMTGYDLLREVRADPNLATTPFIMITAESKTENVIAAKKAGVNNYIVKPFNAATLKTKIEAVFPDMATRVSRSLAAHISLVQCPHARACPGHPLFCKRNEGPDGGTSQGPWFRNAALFVSGGVWKVPRASRQNSSTGTISVSAWRFKKNGSTTSTICEGFERLKNIIPPRFPSNGPK